MERMGWLSLKWVIIYMICALIGLESILFVHAGFFPPKDADAVGIGSLASLFEKAPGGSLADRFPFLAGLNQSPSADEVEFGQARQEAEERGLLLLANKGHALDMDYLPNDLTPLRYYAEDRSKEGRFLREEAADHFHQMVEAAAADGYTLVMTTAYRSYGFQQILWNNYVATQGEEAAAKFSAKPGHSEHQTGLAVDISSPSVGTELTESFGKTKEGIWLAENAHQYGFILRYPKGKEDITGYQYEPWHFRYVGQSMATYIYENDLTLEEFLQE